MTNFCRSTVRDVDRRLLDDVDDVDIVERMSKTNFTKSVWLLVFFFAASQTTIQEQRFPERPCDFEVISGPGAGKGPVLTLIKNVWNQSINP